MVDVDVSAQADVEMVDSGSLQSGATGAGVTMVSMFQTDMVAVRASVAAAWQHVQFNAGSPSQPAGCVVMPVSY